MIGIYKFVFRDSYCYVGQSNAVEKRIAQHQRLIADKTHPNMRSFEDYAPSEIQFSILKECPVEELNYWERYFYAQESLNYTMLNRRTCGLQGIPGETVVFQNDEIPILEWKDGDFYLNNFKIDRIDDKYCLSQVANYINNNSNWEVRMTNILNSEYVSSRIEAVFKISLTRNRRIIPQLKAQNLYTTKGARETKRVYVHGGIFLLAVYQSCPQLAASIVRIITDQILGE